MDENFLPRERLCTHCQNSSALVSYTRNSDGVAWRCMNSSCIMYKKYKSVRIDTFFDKFSTDLRTIFLILIKYAIKTPLHSIIDHSTLSHGLVEKIINNLIDTIPQPDFSNNKLGGVKHIVQIDETMLNYKCKSHRGRSPANRTDALCIVEVGQRITRAYASVIPDKRSRTIIPIIMSQVAPNSIIWTDEHRSYQCLSRLSFVHGTVCHKYEFINSESGVNTQAVESFNNLLKVEIKSRKGVKTELRQKFLNEMCFKFNNKNDLLNAFLNLLKVNN